jgi:hypothetical protein
LGVFDSNAETGGDGPLPLMRAHTGNACAAFPTDPARARRSARNFLGPAPFLASELSAYVTGINERTAVVARAKRASRDSRYARAPRRRLWTRPTPHRRVRKATRAPPRVLGLRPPSGQRAGGAGRVAKAAAGQMGLQAAACPAQS